MISDPESKLTAALLKLGAVVPLGHFGYMFTWLRYMTTSQGLSREEGAMATAEAEFKKQFPKAQLWVHTRLD
jgi:hypothetical protein